MRFIGRNQLASAKPQSGGTAAARRSSIIAFTYVSLWTAYYLLVHASNHSDGKQLVRLKDLNPAAFVLLVETTKLLVSLGIFIAQVGVRTVWSQARSINRGMAFLLKQYFPVALLYAAYNNLMIINLRFFDPTTYLIISSIRLIMTAVVWQFSFGRQVPTGQRKALVIITLGVLIKESPQFFTMEEKSDSTTLRGVHICLVFTQMLCSVMATVYNEVLLKKYGSNINDHPQLQNVCLYMDSIFINMTAFFLYPLFMVLISSTEAPNTSTLEESLSLLCSSVLPIAMILTLSAVGIVTSLMLRHVNSIAKAVASSSEFVVTTVLGNVFFGYHITYLISVSVALVAGGTYIYATDTGTVEGGNGVAPVQAQHQKRIRIRNKPRTTLVLLMLAAIFWCGFQYFFLVFYDRPIVAQHKILQKPEYQQGRHHSVTASNIRNKSSAWLDENLHQLSHWTFSSSEWERFVQLHLSNPMLKVILNANGCRLLEIGSGAGAFSRSLSRIHPNVQISAVDYSDKLVAMSQAVVGRKTLRFNAHVASMEDTTSMRTAVTNISRNLNGVVVQKPSFHVVAMIGSLCYMPNKNSVMLALTNALENLKIGGLLVASMLPETKMAMRSCETLVTRGMLIEMSIILKYDILSIVDMEHWEIGDQKGRYLAILRKTGYANINQPANIVQPENQSTTSFGLGTHCLELSKPEHVTQLKFDRVLIGLKVLEFIVTKLRQVGAPVAITFGTALHEFRTGNDTCFKPRVTDKDIDIAVFEQHLALIIDMDVDIQRLFGWTVLTINRGRLFVTVVPLDKSMFKLDFYGFRCNVKDDLVEFPWDKISTRLNAFLPLRQHVSLQTPLSNGTLYDVYMPANPACFLENIYGVDFETPQDTKFYRPMAVDNPICVDPVLGASERLEFMRQLQLCGGCNSSASSENMEVIANATIGLPGEAPLCSHNSTIV